MTRFTLTSKKSMDRTFAPPLKKLKLHAYVFKYTRQFWLQAAGGIVYNTVIVFGNIYLGKTIDAANLVYHGEAALSFFYLNLFSFIGLTIFFQLARYFKRYYMRELVNLMRCDIRAGLMSALFAMPMKDLSKEKVGDMMSRMIGDVEQIGASVQTTVTEMWDTVLLMLSYFTACILYSPKITFLSTIPVPIVIMIANLLRRPLYNLSLKSRKAASNINIHLQHNISGIALLRLFGLEDVDRYRFSDLLDEQLKWNVSVAALQSGIRPLYILLASSGIILAVGIGGELVVSGIWTIGMFTAFLAMFTAMTTRTNVAAGVMNTWHGAKASWDRICDKLSSTVETEVLFEASRQPSKNYLKVHSLSFTYPFGDESVLQNVSFTANKGEIIGITGPVGSGKSALAAALSGLFPYDGDVLVDGVALKALGEQRNNKIAYMDAEHFVFSDDMKFNITLDRECGSLENVLSLASLEQDVEGFEKGLGTRLMERGVRISGGQRQRIALARAWFGNSEILLLDDPFSAIDINMERKIIENIHKEQLSNGRVVLLFSHRLAAFRYADKILVMEKGCISQEGSHEELMEQHGIYREIYVAQEFMKDVKANAQ
jgi:ABC-type multidrug transport system fused ATPase/permease subunit